MKKLLFIIVVISVIASLVSCRALFPEKNDTGVTPGGDNGDTGGNENLGGDSGQDEPEPKLVLAENGVANFKFVTTSNIGSAAIRNVDKTIQSIRKMGFDIADRATDNSTDQVSECEVLVGLDIRFRGNECSISRIDIGNRGYVIKVVGSRVVIAGGTHELTNKAFEIFKTEYLGLTDGGESVKELSVPETLYDFHPTEYKVDSVSIAGNDLSLYKMFVDERERVLDTSISLTDMQNALFDKTGYLVEIGDDDDLDNTEYAIILRYTNNAGAGGYRHYFEGNNLVFESEYKNALYYGFETFMKQNVLDIGLDVHIPRDTRFEKDVRTVRYSDFGAKGDGESDDYEAIYAAHTYANEGGQTVYADDGAVYYLNSTPYPINIRTSVEFGNAKFIIDDRGDEVHAQKSQGLFRVVRDIGGSTLSNLDIPDILQNKENGLPIITRDTTELPWIVPFLTADSMVRMFDAEHRDYVRYGANQNGGNIRQDVILVSADGKISPDTPPAYDFYNINNIHIFRCDDTPITINGGSFETIACRTVAATDYVNKWAGYYRGFTVSRANVTIQNLHHTVVGEPEATPANNNFNPRNESYPYYGFIFITESYNVLVKDSTLVGRKRYYEDKPITESSSESVQNQQTQPVPMGSYDFVIEHSSHTVFDNVQQTNSITDHAYWGIMSSNGSKNMTFVNCAISRYDAHRSFFNGTLIDTKVGHTFNVIGGGTLYAKNCVRVSGDTFISLRQDYGATFNGDIILEDCTLQGYKTHTGGSLPTSKYTKTYVVTSGYSTAALYLTWDFGYTCYMPRTVTLINYKAAGTPYVFNNISNKAFDANKSNMYVITEEIIFKNMNKISICPSTSSSYSKLRAIKTTVIS